MSELANTYQEIALERPHICTGCSRSENLSHSHLVPKSRNGNLKAVKENITYHCLSIGERVGCHTKWEGVDAVSLDDFETNMEIVHRLDREYFWIRMHKLADYWTIHNRDKFLRVRRLMDTIDKLEHSKEREEKINFMRSMGMI